jgi:hypothetical protein
MSEAHDIAAAFGARICAVCGAVRTGIDWLFRRVPCEYPGAHVENDRSAWVYVCRVKDVDCHERIEAELQVDYPEWWREMLQGAGRWSDAEWKTG